MRPARAGDSDFVYQVKKAALGEYIEQTWGWDEVFQRNLHVREYNPTATEIISWQGTEVGWLEVERGSDNLFLSGIYILPEYQSRGVGSAVIRQIIREAKETQLPLRLEVLKVNPRAQVLYEKLGFVVTGESETHNLMRLDFSPRGAAYHVQPELSDRDTVVTSDQFGPVKLGERQVLLDVLRGFAILGIVLVNHDIGGFHTEALFPSALDRLGHTLVYVLGLNKFWPLFALLFGIGFAVQLERATARNVSVVPTYLRRLFFLALIGCCVHLFVDVPQLLWLAIAGFPMLLLGYALRHRSPWWLLVIATAMLVLDTGMSIPWYLERDQGMVGPPDVAADEVSARLEQFRADRIADAEQDASWSLDRLGSRIQRMLRYYVNVPRYFVRGRGRAASVLLEYMLLGIVLWRVGVLQNVATYRWLFRRVLIVSLPLGLAAAIFTNTVEQAWALTQYGLGKYPAALSRLVVMPLHTVGPLGVVAAYISIIALLTKHTVWAWVVKVFAPVGRMALTNYALQALLPALLFGAYTPGVSQMSLRVWMSIAVLLGLFGLQVVFSNAWLRFYQFGPLEWLLRSLTYWRPQPMRLIGAA